MHTSAVMALCSLLMMHVKSASTYGVSFCVCVCLTILHVIILATTLYGKYFFIRYEYLCGHCALEFVDEACEEGEHLRFFVFFVNPLYLFFLNYVIYHSLLVFDLHTSAVMALCSLLMIHVNRASTSGVCCAATTIMVCYYAVRHSLSLLLHIMQCHYY